MPTIDGLLKQARARLAHVETPALDARLLLQAASGFAHAELVADPGFEVQEDVAALFERMIARRETCEPVSRILGQREFYGRAFKVTPDVLDPRADTEVLVQAVLDLLPMDQQLRIIDLGTGSGAIAVTLLAERPNATAVAVDVSPDALAVALENAQALGVDKRLKLCCGSWFDGVTGRFDGILSNPPYIREDAIDSLSPDVREHDPHLALFAGTDGLDCYRAIATRAKDHLMPTGFVAVEIGAGQESDVTGIFARAGFGLASRHKDLAGFIRCLVFRESARTGRAI